MSKLLTTALLFAAASEASAQLSLLNDDFDDPSTLSDWQRVHTVEGWNADQLETWNIDTSRSGWMAMVPYTSTWFANYRGVLAFKEVTGNFAMTIEVESLNRAQTGPPGRQYSLAGIMLRAPRAITPATWTPGGEDYVFLSLGAANTPGTAQYEVKTTVDSVSVLNIQSAPSTLAEIRSARIGNAFIMLRREAPGPWVVHRRYSRSDMPATLQAGITCYTDWENVNGMDPFTHNSTVNTGGQPDLAAFVDYAHFTEVSVPAPLAALNLADPGQVTDSQLLAFLGETLDTPQASVGGWELFGGE
ncbi:MAG: hypothetical protein SF028_10285 [Candidatus Sumerlaeia bacterium]|nr:hypothetical protein [Candidatus Sumerlaeia bacterium]